MIAIIDYDAGNLKSVEKAFQYLGEEAVITRDRQELLMADKVILPGVGAFGDAMEKLHRYGLVDTIHEIVDKKTPCGRPGNFKGRNLKDTGYRTEDTSYWLELPLHKGECDAF